MSFTAAVEFAAILAASTPPPSAPAEPAPAGPGLTARERELLILVAQGHTDAQIAAVMFISIRTVRSHLDRIRDKSGYRRRADLTRLALQRGLV
jgi:DNA-binding CsgD family transcriptional regulator